MKNWKDCPLTNINIQHVLDRTYPVRLFGDLRRNPQLLGDLLLDTGQIDTGLLRAALAKRQKSGARLGQVLRESGLVSPAALTEALGIQWGIGRVDLDQAPADPDLLLDIDIAACLRVGCIPWRYLDDRIIIVIEDPFQAAAARTACGLDGYNVAVALAPSDTIRDVLEACYRSELEQQARSACPQAMSCRDMGAGRLRLLTATALAAITLAAVTAPQLLFWILFGWIIIANASISLMRLAALVARLLPGGHPRPLQKAVPRLSAFRDLPVISLLVPLHKEDTVLPALMTHLNGLDYPRELLDVKLLVEENDTLTQKAIRHLQFTDRVDVVLVPENTLKTKPRALNYGLNFCRGEIIGILDAEDRPEVDQLQHVIEHLHYAPPHVACVQGNLDFYNARHNWLSRCFTLEYAIWFRILLAGMRRLNLPVPLGGTTVYFRRRILERIGGWDAHNVTEDADLGMRVARMGYTCEILPSTTWEEANCRALPWIRQRSRWLKGFMMTWLTHMRRPRQLLAELGIPGFIAFQTIFLGGATAYLSIPILWALWIAFAFADPTIFLGGTETIWRVAFASMIIGQAVMLSICIAAACTGGKRHLLPWIITLPFYWPLGALATLKALVEMLFVPFYWDKTRHGTFS